MPDRYQWNLNRARREGFRIAIGHRVTTGPLLRVSGHAKMTDAVSDFATLYFHSEVEFVGENGARSVFVSTDTLLEHPQFVVGFHKESGLPIFLGLNKVMEGHVLILGP